MNIQSSITILCNLQHKVDIVTRSLDICYRERRE
jgi:hypothetical protein